MEYVTECLYRDYFPIPYYPSPSKFRIMMLSLRPPMDPFEFPDGPVIKPGDMLLAMDTLSPMCPASTWGHPTCIAHS